MPVATAKNNEKKRETSKGIVYFVLGIFCVAMVVSYTLPILFEWVGETSQQIFQTTATLTGSVLIGYFGKAGFENYDKHKKLLGFVKNEFEETEGGNG